MWGNISKFKSYFFQLGGSIITFTDVSPTGIVEIAGLDYCWLEMWGAFTHWANENGNTPDDTVDVDG